MTCSTSCSSRPRPRPTGRPGPTPGGAPLRRAAGAGHPHDHAPRTRRLIALVGVRAYPTFELLGLPFGPDKSNAWHNPRDALEVSEGMADFPFHPPGMGRPRSATRDRVMDASPEARAVIDAQERAFRRPAGRESPERFGSGKKRRHAAKNPAVGTPSGRIESVPRTAPGGPTTGPSCGTTGCSADSPTGPGG